MKCLLAEKCLNCNGKPEFMKCKIFVQWFKFRQNESLRSHSRELVKNPF